MKLAGGWPLIALLAGCLGTDVGNPVGDDGGPPGADTGEPGDPILVDLDVTLYDSADDALLPSGARIDLAWITIDRVRLRQAGICEDEVEEDIQGPIPVDMLAPGAPEPLRDLELSPGGYCRVDIEWGDLDVHPGGDVPPGLAGHSFLIEGERADGTRFILRSDRGDEIRLDAIDDTEGFPIDAATSALFVALDATDLFAGVDLDGAAVGGDGVIRIDDDNNDDLLARFEENVDAATRLFGDVNANGELDQPERAPGQELAD